MSEILFYSIARAGGVTLPQAITDPASPHYRPLLPRWRSSSGRSTERLRRFAGRRLVAIGHLAQRLGRRWAEPQCGAPALPLLTTAR